MITINVVKNIKRIIDEKGFIQQRVAQRAGFTACEFSAMMNGRKLMRVEYVPRIADALGVTPSDLFADPDEHTTNETA